MTEASPIRCPACGSLMQPPSPCGCAAAREWSTPAPSSSVLIALAIDDAREVMREIQAADTRMTRLVVTGTHVDQIRHTKIKRLAALLKERIERRERGEM
jgi:hypothetical protein